MDLLNETINKISTIDKTAINKIQKKLNKFLPNPNSLGMLAEIFYKYVGITGEINLSIPKKCTVIACSDHGVAEMKTSAYPIETTVHMTQNYLISKGSVANALSNFSKSKMIVVDMGIATPMDNIAGLINRKIALGTKNCAKEPAMTRQQAIQAINTGIEIANTYTKQNYRCFLPGEMGIANTTSSAAIVATICQLSPEQATGRGTNISDERLRLKIAVVRQALAVNKPNPHDGIDVLARVGGFELGCITGIILGAAANCAFVVLDGFNTGAAALIAATICPAAKNYLMGSHLAAEPAHQQTLETLGLHPYMDMKFRLGEATGSSIAVNLLDAMIKAYQQLCTKNKVLPNIKNVTEHPATFTNKDLMNYMNEIKPLDIKAMEECQFYIDNLTKPINSLGALEDIAVKIAGISGLAKPNKQAKTLLYFTPDKSNIKLTDFTTAFALHANSSITILKGLNIYHDPLSAISYGVKSAEAITKHGDKIIGFCGSSTATQTAAINILNICNNANDIDYGQLLNRHGTMELAAMIGAILGAAHERATILTDDFSSQLAAYIAIKIAPQIKDYLIIPEYSPEHNHKPIKNLINLPSYLNLNLTIGSGCISTLGMKLIDAAMHMVNDMKTFADAAVATANDGPGSSRQKK